MNKTRYFELLAKQKALQGENKFMYDINESEYFELMSYQTILQEQIFYDNRSQYIDLIQKYIDGEINSYKFQWEFFTIYYDQIEISNKLIENLNQTEISSEISFSTDLKIKNFSLLLDELMAMCEFLGDGLSERDFHCKLEKIYFNIQKYGKSILVISNDVKVLQFTIGFFIVISSLSYSLLNPNLFQLIWQSQ